MDDAQQELRLGDKIAWAGLLLVAMLCLSRAMIEHDPFPWWQSDPFRFAPPITGLTPRWALLLNAGIVLGSCLTLLGNLLRGSRCSTINGLLVLIGLGVLSYHMLSDLERVLDASTITATVAALVAASQAGRLPGAQRLLGTVAIGFALMLTLVGAYEVFVTHAQTMQTYEQSRESFLAARGWSDGSFETLAYERRLRNPEPLAWFGLTNVFATFTAASAAGLLSLAVAWWKPKRHIAATAGIAGLICVFGLMLTGSKGGYGVLLIGLTLGAGCVFLRSKRIDGRVIVGLCVLVLAALALRGVIGEQLGERSLLFRWQYLVGSVRIWLHDPLLGCGPGLFQDRYALLKPALSPEDVANPHDVVFAWIATLGIGGLALVAYLVRVLLGIRHAEDDDNPATNLDPGLFTRFALLLVIIPTLLALNMQASVLTASEIVPILIGAAVWVGLSLTLLRSALDGRVIRLGLLVVAAVLMVHAMIEVTGTLIVSASLWAFMIGIASGRPHPVAAKRSGSLMMIIALLGTLGILLMRWGPINAWERELHAAAADATRVADAHALLDALEFSPDRDVQLGQAMSLLSKVSRTPLRPTLDSILPALDQVEYEARQFAINHLGQALDARPRHTQTRVALSQQMLWMASVLQAVGEDDRASAQWDAALALFEVISMDAGGHRWAGRVWEGRVSAFPQSPDREQWLRFAQLNLEQAIKLAPHDPQTALRLMELAIDLGDRTGAQGWARRAIELHEQTRLDPLRGLSEDELARAVWVADDSG